MLNSNVSNRTKSPLSAHFTPEAVKEPTMKLSSKVSSSYESTVGMETSTDSAEVTSTAGSQLGVNETKNGEKSKQRMVPKDATPSDLAEILKQQANEMKLLDEQHDLLQKKLLYDYDQYIQDVGTRDKRVGLEIVNGQLSTTRSGQESRETVHPSPVGTYDLSNPEIIPSYSRVYSQRTMGEFVFIVIPVINDGCKVFLRS